MATRQHMWNRQRIVFTVFMLPSPAVAQTVAGTVLDHDTDAPVPQAEVSLVRDTQVVITVLANHAGRFQVQAPVPGRYVLRVERLGYEPATSAPLELESDRTTPVEVRLSVRPVSLEAIRVVGERRVTHLEVIGYYGRQESNNGHFIDAKQIENQGPMLTTDLFRRVPGAMVLRGRQGMEWTVILRGGRKGSPCPPDLYVDGFRTHRELNSIKPEEIEAMEVYSSASSVPLQYGGTGAACGVVLVWTRVGG